jgi:hypothetical protein
LSLLLMRIPSLTYSHFKISYPANDGNRPKDLEARQTSF